MVAGVCSFGAHISATYMLNTGSLLSLKSSDNGGQIPNRLKSRQIFLIEQEVKRTRHSFLNILPLFIFLVERYVRENSRMIVSMKLSYVTLYCNILKQFLRQSKRKTEKIRLLGFVPRTLGCVNNHCAYVGCLDYYLLQLLVPTYLNCKRIYGAFVLINEKKVSKASAICLVRNR